MEYQQLNTKNVILLSVKYSIIVILLHEAENLSQNKFRAACESSYQYVYNLQLKYWIFTLLTTHTRARQSLKLLVQQSWNQRRYLCEDSCVCTLSLSCRSSYWGKYKISWQKNNIADLSNCHVRDCRQYFGTKMKVLSERQLDKPNTSAKLTYNINRTHLPAAWNTPMQ